MNKKDQIKLAFIKGAKNNKEAAAMVGCSVSLVQQHALKYPDIYQLRQDNKRNG